MACPPRSKCASNESRPRPSCCAWLGRPLLNRRKKRRIPSQPHERRPLLQPARWDSESRPCFMRATSSKRFFVPEVVQTSALDCGPAALKALLAGFRIPVNYARLREACQTDVDGTSIDTLEELAKQLGLHAEQTMLPPEHLFLQALPALVIIRM